jgi:hypothetical protein
MNTDIYIYIYREREERSDGGAIKEIPLQSNIYFGLWAPGNTIPNQPHGKRKSWFMDSLFSYSYIVVKVVLAKSLEESVSIPCSILTLIVCCIL